MQPTTAKLTLLAVEAVQTYNKKMLELCQEFADADPGELLSIYRKMMILPKPEIIGNSKEIPGMVLLAPPAIKSQTFDKMISAANSTNTYHYTVEFGLSDLGGFGEKLEESGNGIHNSVETDRLPGATGERDRAN